MNTVPPPCPSGRYWRVKAGDTLFLIAAEVRSSAAELLRLNPGIDPSNIRVGTLVCLPYELPPCASGLFWTAAPGDTYYTIAQATGTTVEELMALNPTVDPRNLQVGQNICLPG